MTPALILLAAPATVSGGGGGGGNDPNDPLQTGDVGTAGPLGLLLLVVLLIAVVFLVKSMSKHLKRVPRSFDPEDDIQVPDTPAELLEQQRRPGEDLLDQLRRAPRAIEPPRRADGGRPAQPPSED
jgi:hypothetical protein